MATTAMEIEEQKKRDKIAAIISGIFGVILIVLLLFPFFYRLFPIPESEGLMAAFGDVEFAGGFGEAENPGHQVNSNPNSTPDKQEEVITDDNTDTDPIENNVEPTPNPTPTDITEPTDNPSPNPQQNPTPQLDPNATFGGGNNPNNDPGNQGTAAGERPLQGGTGTGDQGDGNGAIGNRPRKQGCDMGSHSGENGVAWVRICVNAQGNVTSAEFVTKTQRGELSTITQSSQKRLAENCAKQYKYDAEPGSGTACGTVPVYFTTQ